MFSDLDFLPSSSLKKMTGRHWVL